LEEGFVFLDYFALFLVFFVVIFVFYAIIAIHDIPYEIAVHRKHPHQDAIHVAGWVSLFTLHVIWPFLWIWSTLYRVDRGWGFAGKGDEKKASLERRLEELTAQVDRLEQISRPPETEESPGQTKQDKG
jgi:hypothetical protein